jgi:predicted XRE-type DNA-binding protein
MDKIKGIENKNDVNMKVIRNELNKVVRNTIDDAREIEKEVSLRQAILDAIWKTLKYTGFSSARDIIGVLESIHRYYRRGILSELFAMYDEGKLVSTTKLRDRHDIQLTTMFSIAPREQVSIQE